MKLASSKRWNLEDKPLLVSLWCPDPFGNGAYGKRCGVVYYAFANITGITLLGLFDCYGGTCVLNAFGHLLIFRIMVHSDVVGCYVNNGAVGDLLSRLVTRTKEFNL